MAVYQHYGTGTGTETKKKNDDDGVGGVGTKNTNTNRLSCVVAFMSTIVAVVVVVIVMYVQAAASLKTSTALDANLLRIRTGTNTVFDYPTNTGELLASFTLSDECVDRSTYTDVPDKDVPWKSACMCLVHRAGPDEFTACKNDSECQHMAAAAFSSCGKDNEKDNEDKFNADDFEDCLTNFPYNHHLQSVTFLFARVLFNKNYLVCFRAYPPSSAYP